VKQAADDKAFPEQLEQLGLAAWRVSKVYQECGQAEAHVNLDNNKARVRLEASARDFAAGPARLHVDAPQGAPGERYFRLLYSTAENAERQTHFFQGLAMAEGETRRKLPEPAKDTEALVRAIRERRNLEMIVDKLDNPDRTLGQIAPVLAKLPDDQ